MKTRHPDRNTIKTGLRKAFRNLEKLGYTCKHNFGCCRSCATAELDKMGVTHTVFYDSQGHDHLVEKGEVYLYWSGDMEAGGKLICKEIKKAGLKTKWNGTVEKSILVRA